MTDGPVASYDERLPVPPAVWLVALVLDATFAIALGAALGPVVGWVTLVVTWLATALALRAATGRVRVVGGVLEAGRARLPVSAAGRVTPLEARPARELRGPGADARAYLWLRGWVPTAVRVDVDDPGDPTPYWYVSTRHPAELAAAIDTARAQRA